MLIIWAYHMCMVKWWEMKDGAAATLVFVLFWDNAKVFKVPVIGILHKQHWQCYHCTEIANVHVSAILKWVKHNAWISPDVCTPTSHRQTTSAFSSLVYDISKFKQRHAFYYDPIPLKSAAWNLLGSSGKSSMSLSGIPSTFRMIIHRSTILSIESHKTW